jgi:hypothetical protein
VILAMERSPRRPANKPNTRNARAKGSSQPAQDAHLCAAPGDGTDFPPLRNALKDLPARFRPNLDDAWKLAQLVGGSLGFPMSEAGAQKALALVWECARVLHSVQAQLDKIDRQRANESPEDKKMREFVEQTWRSRRAMDHALRVTQSLFTYYEVRNGVTYARFLSVVEQKDRRITFPGGRKRGVTLWRAFLKDFLGSHPDPTIRRLSVAEYEARLDEEWPDPDSLELHESAFHKWCKRQIARNMTRNASKLAKRKK